LERKSKRQEDNSTQPSKSKHYFDADQSFRGLQERIDKLERVVAQLAAANDIDPSLWPVPEAKRPGRKPAHTPMLIHNRDELVQMLEAYWPELEPLCSPKPNEAELKKVLTAIRPQFQDRHQIPARHLLKHLPELVKFLGGNRFRRDPRQMANALAGAPDIGTWRSLKVCQGQPCNAPLGTRAIRAYIRRKHPDLHGRLSADDSLVNFAAALRNYKTKDQNLQGLGAQYLFAAWKQGEADYNSLNISSRE